MNKTDLLFHMLEHPEDYSEAQWQEVLADDECREIYTLMAKTKSAALSSQITDDEIDTEWQRLTLSSRKHTFTIPLWRKIAAAAAIVIALFGITYAAIRTGFFGIEKKTTAMETPNKVEKLSTKDNEPTIQEISQNTEISTEEVPVKTEPRLYDNVPLEQILTELSAYYHVDVEYQSEDVRSLRLYYQWEPDYSLDKVVEMLSHFETFNIHLENDKLIVESASQEGKQ